jgi:hypothetical protein
VFGSPAGVRSKPFDKKIQTTQEALMARTRSDRALVRARDLLETFYPAPDDAEFQRLQELAIDYIEEAGRLEADNRGRVLQSRELISAALDAVARDFFRRAPVRKSRAEFSKQGSA